MLNWFGLESHPSDSIVHWSEIRHRDGGKRLEKNIQKRIKELRAAWDVIHSDPKIAAAFKIVAGQMRDYASSEQGELEAGEDL